MESKSLLNIHIYKKFTVIKRMILVRLWLLRHYHMILEIHLSVIRAKKQLVNISRPETDCNTKTN